MDQISDTSSEPSITNPESKKRRRADDVEDSGLPASPESLSAPEAPLNSPSPRKKRTPPGLDERGGATPEKSPEAVDINLDDLPEAAENDTVDVVKIPLALSSFPLNASSSQHPVDAAHAFAELADDAKSPLRIEEIRKVEQWLLELTNSSWDEELEDCLRFPLFWDHITSAITRLLQRGRIFASGKGSKFNLSRHTATISYLSILVREQLWLYARRTEDRQARKDSVVGTPEDPLTQQVIELMDWLGHLLFMPLDPTTDLVMQSAHNMLGDRRVKEALFDLTMIEHRSSDTMSIEFSRSSWTAMRLLIACLLIRSRSPQPSTDDDQLLLEAIADKLVKMTKGLLNTPITETTETRCRTLLAHLRDVAKPLPDHILRRLASERMEELVDPLNSFAAVRVLQQLDLPTCDWIKDEQVLLTGIFAKTVAGLTRICTSPPDSWQEVRVGAEVVAMLDTSLATAEVLHGIDEQAASCIGIWDAIMASHDDRLRSFAFTHWIEEVDRRKSSNLLVRLLTTCADEGSRKLSDDDSGVGLVLILEFLLRDTSLRTFDVSLRLAEKLTVIQTTTYRTDTARVIQDKLVELCLHHKPLLGWPEKLEEAQTVITKRAIDIALAGSAAAIDFLNFLVEALNTSRTQAHDKQRQCQLKDGLYDISTGSDKETFNFAVRLYGCDYSVSWHSWSIDHQTTIGEMVRNLKKAVRTRDIRIFTQRVEIDAFEYAEVPLAPLMDRRNPILIVAGGSKGSEAMPNEAIESPRGLIEKLIVDRQYHFQDLLYEEGSIGRATATLLSNLNIVKPNDPTILLIPNNVFDPELPSSKWRAVFVAKILTRTAAIHHVSDQNFVKSGLKVLVNLMIQRTTGLHGVEAWDTEAFATMSRTLAQLLREYRSEPDFSGLPQYTLISILHRYLRRIVKDKASKADLEAVFRCILQVASCSPRNTESFQKDALLHNEIRNGFNERYINEFLAVMMTEYCESEFDLDHTDCARALATPDWKLHTLSAMKIAIWGILWQVISCTIDKGALGIFRLPLYVAASTCLLRVTTLSVRTDHPMNVSECIYRLLEGCQQAADGTFSGNEEVIGKLCNIVWQLADFGIAHNQSLMVPDSYRRILERLLFDGLEPLNEDNIPLKTLIAGSVRLQAMGALLAISTDQASREQLLESLNVLLDDYTPDLKSPVASADKTVRAPENLSGLINLGQTCYLNSMLQQLYMNEDFRRYLLGTPIVDREKQQILYSFHRVFSALQRTQRSACDPSALTKAMDIDVRSQEDAQLFFSTLLSSLEDNMPSQETKTELYSFFKGRNRTQTTGECRHISDTSEEYVVLPLTVKHRRTLHDSLQEYVEGERLDEANKFSCSQCELEGQPKFVTAVRRTRLEHVPDTLIIGLKRFEYDMTGATKINDQFDFPPELDLSPFKIDPATYEVDNLPPDEFELVGVIVHQGSLNFGHYWSYVREYTSFKERAPQWYKVEDSTCRKTNLDTVLRETNATPMQIRQGWVTERPDNAYMLFYRRKNITTDRERILEKQHTVTDEVMASIESDNKIAKREAQLCDEACSKYLFNLLEHAQRTSDNIPACRAYAAKAVTVALKFFLKVSLQDNSMTWAVKLCELLENVLQQHPSQARRAVNLAFDEKLLDYWLLAATHKMAGRMHDLLLAQLDHLRETEPEAYGIADSFPRVDSDSMVEDIVAVLKSRQTVMAPRKKNWPFLFAFLEEFSDLGPVEARSVAEADFFTFAVELLYSALYSEYRKRFPGLEVSDLDDDGILWNPVVSFITYALTNLIDYRSNYVHREESDDGWSSGYPERIYASTEQGLLVSEVFHGIGYSLPRLFVSAVMASWVGKSTKPLELPAGNLLAYLVSVDADEILRNTMATALQTALGNAEDDYLFRKLYVVVRCICHADDVSEGTKGSLLLAALERAEYDEDVAIMSIELVRSLLGRMGSGAADTVSEWMAMLMTTDSSGYIRKAMLGFMRNHCFQEPIDDERHSQTLRTSLRTLETKVSVLSRLHRRLVKYYDRRDIITGVRQAIAAGSDCVDSILQHHGTEERGFHASNNDIRAHLMGNGYSAQAANWHSREIEATHRVYLQAATFFTNLHQDAKMAGPAPSLRTTLGQRGHVKYSSGSDGNMDEFSTSGLSSGDEVDVDEGADLIMTDVESEDASKVVLEERISKETDDEFDFNDNDYELWHDR